MSEIKCYALTIPDDEIWNYWMKVEGGSKVFQSLEPIGINPDPAHCCQHLLFRTPDDRKEAYMKIHEAYPESLCAFNPQVAFIDTKYLKKNSMRMN